MPQRKNTKTGSGIIPALKHAPRSLAGLAVRAYQRLLSPLFGPNCRYYPCCSDYARTALSRFGTVKGTVLTAKRILRCHPFSKHPFTDPVPEEFAWKDIISYKRKTTEKQC